MFTRPRPIFSFAVTVAVIAVICAGAARRQDADTRNDPPGYDAFLDSVRAGVLKHVPASARGARSGNSAAVVSAATSFIAARSGIAIAPADEARLVALETDYDNGIAPIITAEALAEALAYWAVEDVLATATPEEIDRSIESARGFDAPDLPDGFKRGRSRLHVGVGASTVWATPAQARDLIAKAREESAVRLDIVPAIRDRVTKDIAERITYLNRASSGRFDASDLSPIESMLITYSIGAGDVLAGSTSELQLRMVDVQKGLARQNGSYPSPSGRLPYGGNGYLHASPADLFMSRLGALLARIGGAR